MSSDPYVRGIFQPLPRKWTSMSNERHMTEQQFQSIAASTLLRLINDQADTIAEQEDRIEELEAAITAARHALGHPSTRDCERCEQADDIAATALGGNPE